MKLLDLFCCMGGAGEGYRRAGFDVTGVDINPQPRNPHRFILGDALEYVRAHGHEYDAIHASPPCQFASTITPKESRKNHHNWIPATRAALMATGKPYVIENVGGARKHLINPFMLCGTMFGLVTPCGAELQRHRYFESSVAILAPQCMHGSGAGIRNVISIHGDSTPKNEGAKSLRKNSVIGIYAGTAATANTRRKVISVNGDHQKNDFLDRVESRARRKVISVTGATPQQNIERNTVRETFSVNDAAIAMGIDWMTMKGLSQAIPPAYTEYIGRLLMAELKRR